MLLPLDDRDPVPVLEPLARRPGKPVRFVVVFLADARGSLTVDLTFAFRTVRVFFNGGIWRGSRSERMHE